MDSSHDNQVILAHAISTSTIIMTVLGWLPAMAAAAAFLWYVISIYETKTVQDWLTARRRRKATVNVSSPSSSL